MLYASDLPLVDWQWAEQSLPCPKRTPNALRCAWSPSKAQRAVIGHLIREGRHVAFDGIERTHLNTCRRPFVAIRLIVDGDVHTLSRHGELRAAGGEA
jgi:hypothetical protein